MLAQRHARRESIEGSSKLLSYTHTQLLSFSLWTTPASARPPFCPLAAMPRLQCPVQGCQRWDSSWGNKSYPLPSPDVFTLQLNSHHRRLYQQPHLPAVLGATQEPHDEAGTAVYVSSPSQLPHLSTLSSLQPSALSPLPLTLFPLRPLLSLCPLLLRRQRVLSRPLQPLRSFASFPPQVPTAIQHQSYNRPTTVPP